MPYISISNAFFLAMKLYISIILIFVVSFDVISEFLTLLPIAECPSIERKITEKRDSS